METVNYRKIKVCSTNQGEENRFEFLATPTVDDDIDTTVDNHKISAEQICDHLNISKL